MRDCEAQLLRAEARIERRDELANTAVECVEVTHSRLPDGSRVDRAVLQARSRSRSARPARRAARGSLRRSHRAARHRDRAPSPRRTLTAQAAWLTGTPFARGADSTTIVLTQLSSSTRRTIVRAVVLKLVGRYGVARNAAAQRRNRVLGLCHSAIVIACKCCVPCRSGRRPPPCAASPPALGTRSSPPRATARARRRPQQSRPRSAWRRAAMPQPASRSGIEDAGPASVTGRMKASSSDVVAPASTELTTPAKITAKPTSAVAAAASHTFWRDERAQADERASRERERGLGLQPLAHRVHRSRPAAASQTSRRRQRSPPPDWRSPAPRARTSTASRSRCGPRGAALPDRDRARAATAADGSVRSRRPSSCRGSHAPPPPRFAPVHCGRRGAQR